MLADVVLVHLAEDLGAVVDLLLNGASSEGDFRGEFDHECHCVELAVVYDTVMVFRLVSILFYTIRILDLDDIDACKLLLNTLAPFRDPLWLSQILLNPTDPLERFIAF